jgi:hypothetical protein
MDKDTMKLMEKIIRAKVKLESMKKDHSNRCIVELDPEGYAPCSCGATSSNSNISSILDELKL